MTIARITVPAAWGPAHSRRSEVAEFKLGEGPCGLTVTSLVARIGNGCLSIVQEHEESPAKVFVYPLAQLTGRVEYEVVE